MSTMLTDQNKVQPMDVTDLNDPNRSSRRVAYYYDHDVGNYHFFLGHPMKPHRIRMTHNLVSNYGLCDEVEEDAPEAGGEGSRALNDVASGMDAEMKDAVQWEKRIAHGPRGKHMQVFRPRRANKTDMTRFHTDEYIDLLEAVTPETAEAMTGGGIRCLTGEDCPAFEGVFEFCTISAGGSLGAAEKLNSGSADIAVNWAGGLHHAKKSEASGFCYVNDIVLGILELLRIHPRVLYIDVDVHHGDGVEEAFYTTDRVMTASFHRFGEFFPGTGDVRDTGIKRGKGYAVNVPLRDGITDATYHTIFKPVIKEIIDRFQPGAIVLQMGADSLSGDKLGGFNMTLNGHAECASFVRSFNIPVLMVGGGGYTIKNVAKAWTKETAIMCGVDLPEDLPYNRYMEYFGPRYKLEVLPTNVDDHNPPEYVEALRKAIFENLKQIPHAPGVQMREVPGKPLSRALGISKDDDDDPDNELDNRIKKLFRARQNGMEVDSESESDSDTAAFARPNRARRQGGLSLRPNPRPRVNGFPSSKRQPSSSPDEDDENHRRKRSFFSSRAGDGVWDPTILLNGGQPPAEKLVNGAKPKLFGGIPETWNVGRTSRAGSPMSVI
ncbi:hypothetical protein Q8F55_005740 [Vanrija albida]|uniref:Histone deacetylase domain-containing protein n=1 Tax=Vanrija albida TaxID=181172 RepID=A0ABR3Q2H7_9TREE